jgi:hypothetical protein
MQDLKLSEVVTAPDWTPWGQPRRGAEGIETAFHHRLVLIREAGGAARIAKPAEAFVGTTAGVEWSPMLWALSGERPGRGAGSLERAQVIVGARDRLFTTINSVCEQIFEGGVLGVSGLQRWVAALEARLAFCQARGIVYRHLVVPDSHSIYADAMPGAPRLSENRPLRRILAAASPELREAFVYPLDALVDGRAQEETSFPHDVHPTGWGAFLIYRALATRLPAIDPATILTPDDLRIRSFLHAGDVARAAGLPARRVTMHEAPPVPQQALVKGSTYRTHQVDVLVGEDSALPRLVMFRTSNSTQQFPYLIRYFSRIAAVASVDVFYDLIESERPDVVVAEMPERYFASARLSVDTADFGTPPQDLADAFESRTGHALPLPGVIRPAQNPAP